MNKVLKAIVSTLALFSLISCTDDNDKSTEIKKQYKVTFLNYDDSFLYETMAFEGCEAKYSGPTPTREVEEETDDFYYEFTGWDKDVSCITCELTTKATYELIFPENWGPIIWD